jgi:hypothetical protein
VTTDPKDTAEATKLALAALGSNVRHTPGIEYRVLMTIADQWAPWPDMTVQQRAALVALVAHRINRPDEEPPALIDPPPEPWLGRAMGLPCDEQETLVLYWELLRDLAQ